MTLIGNAPNEDWIVDATERHIKVGDYVVYSDSKGETSSLKQGVIVGFTSKKIRIEVDNARWKVDRGEPVFVEILKFPEQIARINK